MSLSNVLMEVLREARARKFLGAVPVEAQVANGSAFARVLEAYEARTIVDLGSGGGVPALIVAELLGHAKLCMVERGANRADWLAEAVERVGLGHRVRVVLANAEDAARQPDLLGWADAVTARSFAPPAVTAECACRMLRDHGVLVVSEPPPAPDEPSRWPLAKLQPTGLVPIEFSHDGTTSLQILRREGPIEDRLPRRAAVTRRRPLF